jgi:PII-like signaling protein
MTSLNGHALKLTIIIGEDDVHAHRPVYSEIVILAREEGLAGATVVRGIESFGRRSLVHTSRLVSLSNDLPVVITIIDDASKIRAFLPRVTAIVTGGIVTVEDVAVVHYVGETTAGERAAGSDDDIAPGER